MVELKLDKGMVKRLLSWKVITKDDAKNLDGKELTLEIRDIDIAIQKHKKMLEISDVNGSFTLWIKLNEDKIKKLKELLGP